MFMLIELIDFDISFRLPPASPDKILGEIFSLENRKNCFNWQLLKTQFA